MVGLDGSYLGQHGITPSQLAGLMPVSGQMVTHSTIREERHVPATTPLIECRAAYHAAKESPPCLCLVGDESARTDGRERLSPRCSRPRK